MQSFLVVSRQRPKKLLLLGGLLCSLLGCLLGCCLFGCCFLLGHSTSSDELSAMPTSGHQTRQSAFANQKNVFFNTVGNPPEQALRPVHPIQFPEQRRMRVLRRLPIPLRCCIGATNGFPWTLSVLGDSKTVFNIGSRFFFRFTPLQFPAAIGGNKTPEPARPFRRCFTRFFSCNYL